jgi:predicted phage terminase large subunit-like protein
MGVSRQTINISAQAGQQELFLATPADIAIYGGAAGGGKTWAVLVDPLRYHFNKDFNCVYFRANRNDITKPGGLWDQAKRLYLPLKAKKRDNPYLDFSFTGAITHTFTHLNELNYEDYSGAEIIGMYYEELQLISETAFWFMLSRNRSVSGVRPYIRATANPRKNWLYELIKWWIGEDGYPIKERSGVIRYFVRLKNNEIIWGDTREELINKFGKDYQPKSFTFIYSTVEDNKILLEKSPEYKSNLMALDDYNRERLLKGNWLATAAAGTYFKREYVEYVNYLPDGVKDFVRVWDRAATKPSPENPDPDYTAGLLMCRDARNVIYICNMVRFRDLPLGVEDKIKKTAEDDKRIYGQVKTILLEDPGQAGKMEAQYLIRQLAGHWVDTVRAVKDKLTYFRPFSTQAQARNFRVLRKNRQDDEWIDPWINELEQFVGDDEGHDDQVDVTAHAFLSITGYNEPRIMVI